MSPIPKSIIQSRNQGEIIDKLSIALVEKAEFPLKETIHNSFMQTSFPSTPQKIRDSLTKIFQTT